MKPHLHAKNSVKKYGGTIEDYLPIHDFIDSSKIAVPVKMRSVSSMGMFGALITNSEGKRVSTRDLAEEHVIDDLGFIPTMQDYLEHMTLEPWMGGQRRHKRFIPIGD